MTLVIDMDQHLYEYPTMFEDYCAPSKRDLSLSLAQDDLGYTWLYCGALNRPLFSLAITVPEDGFESQRSLGAGRLAKEKCPFDYVDDLPKDYWDPQARVAKLDEFGVDCAMLLPHGGLVWPRLVMDRLDVFRANLEAWNRWAVEVRQAGGGRLEPIGHLTMRGGDLTWFEGQVKYLAANGIKGALVNYGLVDGRRMSSPDHDRAWAALVDNGVVPVFHIQDNDNRACGLPEAWFENDDPVISVVEFSFAQFGVQVTLADLIFNGVFDRFPGLNICCVELTASWLPALLSGAEGISGTIASAVNGPGLDTSYTMAALLTGRHLIELKKRPSEYLREHVRATINRAEPLSTYVQLGMEDMLMFGGDYPHSEGLVSPYQEFLEAIGPLPQQIHNKFYGGNAAAVMNFAQ